MKYQLKLRISCILFEMICFALFKNGHFTTLFRRLPTLFISTLKMTTLFRRCLTLFISTLKYTTLIQRCSTLKIPALKYTTLFQRWFDVAQRRDVVSTKGQRWNNVEMFAGMSSIKKAFPLCPEVNWPQTCTFSLRKNISTCTIHLLVQNIPNVPLFLVKLWGLAGYAIMKQIFNDIWTIWNHGSKQEAILNILPKRKWEKFDLIKKIAILNKLNLKE